MIAYLQKTCYICGEDFDVIWKTDINDWVLENALKVNVVEKIEKNSTQAAEE